VRQTIRVQAKGVDMAQSQSQRLRRLAEKAARRKVVVAEKRKAEAPVTGLRAIIDAAKAPDFACLATEGLFDIGIGWVVAERQLPSGSVGASVFLVDVWCLGIKDAFFKVMTRREFEEHMSRLNGEYSLLAIDPSVARKLLRDAAAYAASLGLPPSENFADVELIFGDTPFAEETFSFGKDGKPFYVSGPNDSPARKRRIMDTLAKRAGPKNFDFMVDVAGLD
jgi:hypothetical protein